MQHTHDHDHHHSADAASVDELVAMLRYMTAHNRAHADELQSIADGFHTAGMEHAATLVSAAIASFGEGNALLAAALDDVTED